MEVRQGEERKAWFRTERFYHSNDGWWFFTRETGQEGPFVSQKDAEQEFFLYLRNLTVYNGLFDPNKSK